MVTFSGSSQDTIWQRFCEVNCGWEEVKVCRQFSQGFFSSIFSSIFFLSCRNAQVNMIRGKGPVRPIKISSSGSRSTSSILSLYVANWLFLWLQIWCDSIQEEAVGAQSVGRICRERSKLRSSDRETECKETEGQRDRATVSTRKDSYRGTRDRQKRSLSVSVALSFCVSLSLSSISLFVLCLAVVCLRRSYLYPAVFPACFLSLFFSSFFLAPYRTIGNIRRPSIRTSLQWWWAVEV